MNREADETFPETIPLPYYEYAGQVRNSTIVAPDERIASSRRSRTTPNFATLQVRWILSIAQYAAFRAFVEKNLGNATALFNIQLRYPSNLYLDGWIVRFTGGKYLAAFVENKWNLEATLDLVRQVVMDGLVAEGDDGDTLNLYSADDDLLLAADL